ncbi:hypothetical protein HDV03_001219 [Kappamyces sp. JEL0829]|nr:hypothetical protein HDV03_001219 [Kappamyces sp. JEL0829]
MCTLMQENSRLLNLPHEITYSIVSYLSWQQVVALEATCHSGPSLVPPHYWQRVCASYGVQPGLFATADQDQKHDTIDVSTPEAAKRCFAQFVAAIRPFYNWNEFHRIEVLNGLAVRLVNWLSVHYDESLESFNRYHTFDEFAASAFPDPSLAAVYSLESSQSLRDLTVFSLLFGHSQHFSPGLFGSYVVYDTFSTQVWFKQATQRVVTHDRKFLDIVKFSRGIDPNVGYAVVARSTGSKRLVGRVVLIRGNHIFEIAPSFLAFISRHIENLETKVLPIVQLAPEEPYRIISAYPTVGPGTSQGPVVYGLQINLSSIPHLVLERGAPLVYSYQISMHFSPAVSPFGKIELVSRHWRIKYSSDHIENVNGRGVIGLYPRFDDSTTTFSYSSRCMEMVGSRPLWMEGELNFKGVLKTSAVDDWQPFSVPVMRAEFLPPLD